VKLYAAIGVCVFALGCAQTEYASPPPNWRPDFQSALVEAGARHTMVMVEFYAVTCPLCGYYDKMFTEQDIAQRLSHLVPYRSVYQTPANQVLVARYPFKRYPVIVFVRPDGSEAYRIEKFPTSREFLRALDTVLKMKA
jgi:thiol:disulfide interchange protein